MTTYEDFLTKLKLPEAVPLTNHLKGFLAHFTSEKRPVVQQRKLVLQFLQFAYTESLHNPVFSGISEDAEKESVREGWEKLVMIKLYDSVFGAPGTEEHKMNAHLQRKIESFHWVQERHLDLPFEFQHTLEVAQAELLKINGYRAPKDKLTILLNTTQLVVGLIQNGHENAGNDHLLPALILCIIRANPSNLISNMGAISYIYNLSTKSLTLTDGEKATYAKELPKQDTAATASSPEIGQFVSKVYGTTSGWFSNFIREAKVFGEQAAETVDGLVTSLTGPDSPPPPNQPQQGYPAAGGPPLPPRRGNEHDWRYPGQISAVGARQSSLAAGAGRGPEGGRSPVVVFSPQGQQQFTPATGHPPYADMTPEQRAEQEDYELQLALALSLSAMESKNGTSGDGEGSLMQFNEEVPLIPGSGAAGGRPVEGKSQEARLVAVGVEDAGGEEDVEDEEPLLKKDGLKEPKELKDVKESVEQPETGSIKDVEYAKLEEEAEGSGSGEASKEAPNQEGSLI
ncbi:hypothetical protein HDV00_008290 [Rhizophlyctis rosea]|nr:hypothetical protein HDV00_008290 [Rhizophlyctis rosea]